MHFDARHSVRRTRARLAPFLVLAISFVPFALGAQPQSERRVSADPQLELRLDASLSPASGAMLGVGLNVRAGWYARLGIAASTGAVRARGAFQATQRLDGTARFLFDPFAEGRRAFYAGAGLGLQRSASGAVQELLLGVFGVEASPHGRVLPSVEVTIGGGARIGVVLRSRRPQGR